jgi:integrase
MAHKRRGAGEGLIRQRIDGRWEARISLDWQDGRRVRKSFYGASAQEVQEKLLKVRADHANGLPVAVERQMLGQFLTAYLESIRDKVRPRSYERFESLARLHILPAIAKVRLDQLSPQHIQHLIDRKTADGMAAQSVVHIRNLLRLVLNRALRWNLIARNPALLVDVPTIRRAPVAYLQPEQARTLLDAANGERLQALYTVALSLGLRRGEALGLKWEDVDLEGGRLIVRRALQRLREGLTLVETKTAKGNRMVLLPQFAIRALRDHRRRQLEERLSAGSDWHDMGLVFTNRNGSPIDPMTLHRDFRRLLAKAGLAPIHFHVLRHSAAALMLVQGVPLKTIQEVLGHSSLAVTSGFYAHVGEELKRQAAAAMDAIFQPAANAQ